MPGTGMPSKPRPPLSAERDGTSQTDRVLPALDPGYVTVDERSIADFLAFAREYAKELTYFDAQNQPAGTWSGFLPESLRAEDVAAWLDAPESRASLRSSELSQPHRVLFLVFLKLLQRTNQELNAITARHLDYYYRQYLGLVGKPSIPDRVNLVVDLARGARSVLLPAGTQVNAGPDVRGVDRIYVTDRDLVANRAQLAALRSLFVDCRRTTLRQAPLRHANDKERTCELLFRIALGDPLPLFPDGRTVTFAVLSSLASTLSQQEAQSYLPIATLRDLTGRRALRPAAPAEWDEINAKLEIAGTAKRNGQAFTLNRSSQDFQSNLTLAVGTVDLSTLPEIHTLEDLYDQRTRSDVQAFIRDRLYFRDQADFLRMMQLKRKFDSEWAAINQLLQEAGQRKRGDASYQLMPTAVDAFANNLQAALGLTEAQLGAYADLLHAIEDYFCMPGEQFLFAVSEVHDRPIAEWDQIFLILEGAHRDKERRQRRSTLHTLRATTPTVRLVDLIRVVLGEEASASEDPTALDRLVPYLGQASCDKLASLAQEGSWERVDNLLELAWRSRIGEPPAEQQEWMNVYPAADATQVRRATVESTEGHTPQFAPFAGPLPGTAPVPEAVLGWAFSSPLLFLSQGQRTLLVTLGFADTALPLSSLLFREGELALQCEITTEKGLVRCPVTATQVGSYAALTGVPQTQDTHAIQLTLSLDESIDPITAPTENTSQLQSPFPVLRLMMRPIFSPTLQQYRASYPELSQLALVAAHVAVQVSGLQALYLQNEDSSLEAQKPFEPFGSQPSVGSRLLFGHPELLGKPLQQLRLKLDWLGAPSNLGSHYSAYDLGTSPSFSARLYLSDYGRQTTLLAAAPLFGSTGSAAVTVTAGPGPSVAATTMAALLTKKEDDLAKDLSTWDRVLGLELNSPDFQHANYPIVASSKALALAVATTQGTSVNASDYLVRPPYTPKLKSFSIDYKAAVEVRVDKPRDDRDIHRVLHIHPFGHCDAEIERAHISGPIPFFPPYPNEGELYLGLRDMTAPQVVSIFFQVAEGSGNPDLPQEPIRWSYLSADRWLPLDRYVIHDTTRGLRNSGIVELSLPVASASTRMRDSLYWLRASIERDTVTVCDIVGIHTQAVSATFLDRGNAPEHFRRPLPAGSITQLAKVLPTVAGIRQPYTSYGGRTAESDLAFAMRASERLRHKGRSLQPWDYERLILERFPELHKVKCIPARPGQPGQVTVIVIPDIRNKLPFEPFAPRAPSSLLLQAQEYLQDRAPPSAQIAVRNAHYIGVRVRVAVRFRSEGNEEFYKDTLNQDLNRFLSPWAYQEGSDLALGGKIYASSIVDFIDRLPYVDYVAGIKLFRSEDGITYRPISRPADSAGEGYSVATERPDGVLVAARQHQIDALSDATYAENLVTGIDFMKLEFDFVVSEG